MLRIVPKVERDLLKEEVDKSGSRFKSVRPPIAIALLKVLQKLPTSTFNIKLPNLILTICGVLKSKDSSAREAARRRCSTTAACQIPGCPRAGGWGRCSLRGCIPCP